MTNWIAYVYRRGAAFRLILGESPGECTNNYEVIVVKYAVTG